MKKIILIINIFLVSIFNCHAQNYVLQNTITTSTPIHQIEIDPFSNIYIVEDYKISKYSESGKLLAVYQDIENGAISNIDVSNPLKPIVFCKDFSVLQNLDQKLSLVNTINLTERNLDFIETIAVASGDLYWVYNMENNSLQKLNKSLNKIYESESFLNLFSEYHIPLKIIENEQNVYVLNQEGIYLFDNFANYVKTIPIKGLNDFQILNGKLIYVNENNFIGFNLKTFKEEILEMPLLEAQYLFAKVFKNSLLLSNSKEVYIYSVK